MEAIATNFFRQELSREDFLWCFPHPRHTSAMIRHLNNFQARGIFLLICLPSQVAMSRMFRADKTARFVKDITWIKPIEFDFGVERALVFN